MLVERKQFGQFLRDRRVEAGLSQEVVAKKLGYSSAQFVSNWERGISSPPIDRLSNIAEIYQIPHNQLIDVICEETRDYLKAVLKKDKTKKPRPRTRRS